MQEGTLAPGVQEWRLHVEVNGVERAAESVSIDADVASDLPDQVAGVSGVSARTGTIQWAPQNPVSERPATPWTRVGAWPPQPGDRVDIWAGDENTSWKVFTGRIDTSEGGVDSFSSKIIDATDQLDRPVSLEPVAHMMPGAYDEATDTAEGSVRTFVQPWHAAYRALRAGGFGVAAPVQVGGSVLVDVDMQGSVWPSVGTVQADSVGTETSMEWGEGWTYLSDGAVAYTAPPRSFPTGQAVRAWMRWPADSTTTATMRVRQESGRSLRIMGTLNTGGTQVAMTVQVYNSLDQSVYSEASWTVPVMVDDGSVWVEVCVANDSTTLHWTSPSVGATPGTSNGSVGGTVALGSKLNMDDPITTVGVNAPMIAFRVGMLTVTQWQDMSSHVGAPGVHAWGRGLVNSQYVSRTQVKRNARDLLAEIGAATLTAMWIDELGVMQWAPTNVMYTGTPVRTFTTRDDIFELGWVESLQAARRKVYADFQGVALKVASDGYTKTLWSPDRGPDITPGVTEDFIEVPTAQEWFGVDTSMWRASAAVDRFNARKGSFYSAVIENTNDTYNTVGADYSASLAQVTPRTFKLTHTNTSGATIQSMTNPDLTAFRRTLRGFGTPIVRGQGVADLIDMEVTGATTGPSWAPDMNLDLGAWAIKDHAQAIVNWLSSRLASPMVTLTDVEVDYDPRIQLGDIVTIESVALLGMSVNCVVVGKSETHGGGASMSLTVRVIGTRTLHTTYAEFEAAYTGQQYAALQSAWSGATYSGFENSPLGRI